MFSVKISLVKGISIFSKRAQKFFNLKRSGDVEFKIQAGIVNARIKDVTKNFVIARSVMSSPPTVAQDRFRETLADLAALPNQIIRDSALRSE